MSKIYNMKGMKYKVTTNGFVYRQGIDRWLRSTVKEAELIYYAKRHFIL